MTGPTATGQCAEAADSLDPSTSTINDRSLSATLRMSGSQRFDQRLPGVAPGGGIAIPSGSLTTLSFPLGKDT